MFLFLGVEDSTVGPTTNIRLGGVTNRFTFVDGLPEGLDFFNTAFEFPWGSLQPNDGGAAADCVRYSSLRMFGK